MSRATTAPSSSPAPTFQSTSPVPYPTYTYPYPIGVPVAPMKPATKKPKPVNVFSNDGSFLERIQRSRREEEEKRKAQEAFQAKIHFEDRFKRRGKRPAPDCTCTQSPTDHPAKKPRAEGEDSAKAGSEKRSGSV
ncbi:hypothetical protein FB107DRAFT_256605 [Schizophyllum commune]